MQNIVSIDGRYYNIFIPMGGIQRNFSVVDTDNAGRNMQGKMIRDIVGTYYNYTIAFDTKYLNFKEYDDLFQTLSAPQDSHTIIVPYGQETLTFEAYVTSGGDTLTRAGKDGNRWSGLSINFVAMEPQRR